MRSAAIAAPSAGAASTDRLARAELRSIFLQCEVHREALQSDVDDAQRRLRRITGAAAVAWFIGEVASGGAGSRIPPENPTGSVCLPGDSSGAGTARCGAQALGLSSVGHPSPSVWEARSLELDSAQQVNAINRAMDEIDKLLFEHPDPDAWAVAERESYAQLIDVLEALCL